MSAGGEARDRPVVGLDCSYGLYFPADRLGPVLLEIAQLAEDPASHYTNLVLPDGSMVTVPFASWLGDGKTVSLLPISRVRLDVSLRFPPAGAHEDGGPEQVIDPGGIPEPEPQGPVAIRLWVYMGHRHAGLVFFPPGPRTGRLLVGSVAIRRTLVGLLERQQGIVGLLDDIEHGTSYLLPDLRTRIDLPDLTDYYDANQGIDVDRWLEELLRQELGPTLPPRVDPPEKQPEDDTDRVLRKLEAILGFSREPVPPRYHRTFEEKPFDTCDFCARPLLAPDTRYTVTKFFSGGELSQELAICSGCGDELRKGYSAESQEASAQIFASVPVARRALKASREGVDHADRVEVVEEMTCRCLLCDAPREGAKSHVEYALCEGTEIVYSFYPITICDDCMIRIYDALSEKTKEAGRRFYDDHFGFPPPGAPSLQRRPERMPVWISL
jgi:hypothetical protein